MRPDHLVKVLAEHVGSGRTHRYAAGQALYRIGTREAHEVLAKYLLSDDYRVQMGIWYAFRWNMPSPERDGFIRRYHLWPTKKDLQLLVKAVKEGKGAAVVLSHAEVALPLLEKAYAEAAEADKLTYAQALCVMGSTSGLETLIAAG